jgi:hypothetical protein
LKFPSQAAAEFGGNNRRPSHSCQSADAFSDFPPRAMPLRGRSLLREPIDRDSIGSSPAAPQTRSPLRSPFCGDLVGREFAFFGHSVGNADSDSDRDCESRSCNDSGQKFCDVIRPTILSEIREILRLFGGSAPITDRLSIPPETEAIRKADFLSHRGVREVVFEANSHCRTIDGFVEFRSLVRIEIPSSVEIIDIDAFQGCAQLREVIFEANSHLRELSGFWDCSALSRIVIPSSVQLIHRMAFDGCAQLSEVIFEGNSHLREIHGFGECSALARIVIPSSVESITWSAFHGCAQLKEVICEADSHLREIAGFQYCTSLSRMVLPPSLQTIKPWAFLGCTGPRVVEFPFGSRLRNIWSLRRCHCLIVYRDSDLKHSRRGLQMQ